MARYDRGYDGRGGYRGWDWYDGPRRGGPRGPERVEGLGRGGGRGSRGGSGDRPWVGGYRPGYQGGSGGIPTSGGMPPSPPRGRPSGYDGDYWWLGEHELRRQGRFGGYDEAYERFDRESHPRYSPVGGTYNAMGGRYAYNRPPRPLRDDTWFSDWTRWF